jgi:glutathione peroxidase
MMEIVETHGKRQSPLYKWLRDEALKGGDLTWNFEKFLVNSEGKVVGHWTAPDEPNSFADEVTKLLA